MKLVIAVAMVAYSTMALADTIPLKQFASINVAQPNHTAFIVVEDGQVFIDWPLVDAEAKSGDRVAAALLAARSGTWRPMSEQKTR